MKLLARAGTASPKRPLLEMDYIRRDMTDRHCAYGQEGSAGETGCGTAVPTSYGLVW